MSCCDHPLHQAGEVDLAPPAEHPLGLRRVAEQDVDLGRTHELRVLADVGLPVVDADLGERQGQELLDRVRLPGGEDEVVGLVVLEHLPHAADVVAGVAPVPLRPQVAEGDVVVDAEVDLRDGVGDLAGDELQAPALALVVEQDAGGDEHPVALPVVAGDPVGVELGHAVRAARVEQRVLVVARAGPVVVEAAEHLRRRGLVEPRLLLHAGDPDRLEQVEHALGGDVGGELRVAERVADVADRAQVVDLVRARHGPSPGSARSGR